MILAMCNGNYKRLMKKSELSDENFLLSPLDFEERSFDPTLRCEGYEWFFVEMIKEQQEFIKVLKDLSSSTSSIVDFENESFQNIQYLVRIENDMLSFQKINGSSMITNKKQRCILSCTVVKSVKNCYITRFQEGIFLNEYPDAFIKGNRLYFRSFDKIKTIFPKIEIFYKMASEEEVKNFRELPYLQVGKKIKFRPKHCRLIAMILDDNNINLNDYEFWKRIRGEVEVFLKDSFICKNDKFVLENQSDLNNLLDLILGRFFINRMNNYKMRAGSAVKIESTI